MPDEYTDKLIAEFAKQLPLRDVYQDVAAPLARESGEIFADLVKLLRLALAPVQYLAALQDRYKSFLDRSVRRVPEERRISPAAQILGPIIEAIRYEPEGSRIDEMFSYLLSSAMDSDKVSAAHPAFPTLIRQLSSDEAKIIEFLAKRSYERVSTRDFDFKIAVFSGFLKIEYDRFPKDDLAFPNNLPLYIDHLYTLGLAGVFQSQPQQAIMGPDKRFSEDLARQVQTGTRIFEQYQLTAWGRSFYAACAPNSSQPQD